MSIDAHLRTLKAKHDTLSREVEEAGRSPGMDQLAVRALKKRKLAVKEEIARLTTAPAPA